MGQRRALYPTSHRIQPSHGCCPCCRAREYQQQASAEAAAPAPRPLRRGDVAGVLRALRADFEAQYFITGVLTDSIYDEQCYFADPTVSFRGEGVSGQGQGWEAGRRAGSCPAPLLRTRGWPAAIAPQPDCTFCRLPPACVPACLPGCPPARILQGGSCGSATWRCWSLSFSTQPSACSPCSSCPRSSSSRPRGQPPAAPPHPRHRNSSSRPAAAGAAAVCRVTPDLLPAPALGSLHRYQRHHHLHSELR